MSNDTVNRSGKQLEEELTELLGAPWEERRRQYDVRIDQIARGSLSRRSMISRAESPSVEGGKHGTLWQATVAYTASR